MEGSECRVTDVNASSRGIKLANWKTVSAALQKSMQAEEDKAGEQYGSECGVTEVSAS